MAARFDTMTAFKATHEAGVEETAAMASTAAINNSVLDAREELATRDDLENLRVCITASIDTRFAEVATRVADTGKAIQEARAETLKAIIHSTRWNVGALFGVAALIVAAVKFL